MAQMDFNAFANKLNKETVAKTTQTTQTTPKNNKNNMRASNPSDALKVLSSSFVEESGDEAKESSSHLTPVRKLRASYNNSADLLLLAYAEFQMGNIERAMQYTTVAFDAPGAYELVHALEAMNNEAEEDNVIEPLSNSFNMDDDEELDEDEEVDPNEDLDVIVSSDDEDSDNEDDDENEENDEDEDEDITVPEEFEADADAANADDDALNSDDTEEMDDAQDASVDPMMTEEENETLNDEHGLEDKNQRAVEDPSMNYVNVDQDELDAIEDEDMDAASALDGSDIMTDPEIMAHMIEADTLEGETVEDIAEVSDALSSGTVDEEADGESHKAGYGLTETSPDRPRHDERIVDILEDVNAMKEKNERDALEESEEDAVLKETKASTANTVGKDKPLNKALSVLASSYLTVPKERPKTRAEIVQANLRALQRNSIGRVSVKAAASTSDKEGDADALDSDDAFGNKNNEQYDVPGGIGGKPIDGFDTRDTNIPMGRKDPHNGKTLNDIINELGDIKTEASASDDDVDDLEDLDDLDDSETLEAPEDPDDREVLEVDTDDVEDLSDVEADAGSLDNVIKKFGVKASDKDSIVSESSSSRSDIVLANMISLSGSEESRRKAKMFKTTK